MSRWKRPLARFTATTSDDATDPHTPSTASGFLTIGGTTYIDPEGSYPLDHRADGSATLIINDTDRHLTIVTERNSHHSPAPPGDPAAPSPTPAPAAGLVLAPGERTETRQGDSVRVG
ncbi:hypothetical protein OIU91_28685 [Streptomyces sp. NBC_01456]|uniref:hypothetical protein n=1 Tax=unclassified Streptomyces TaxID=2593676 RepID=UPI002E35A8DB|nr:MULTISPECIES: hypothetical protein [unclassified Streptomyces]